MGNMVSVLCHFSGFWLADSWSCDTILASHWSVVQSDEWCHDTMVTRGHCHNGQHSMLSITLTHCRVLVAYSSLFQPQSLLSFLPHLILHYHALSLYLFRKPSYSCLLALNWSLFKPSFVFILQSSLDLSCTLLSATIRNELSQWPLSLTQLSEIMRNVTLLKRQLGRALSVSQWLNVDFLSSLPLVNPVTTDRDNWERDHQLDGLLALSSHFLSLMANDGDNRSSLLVLLHKCLDNCHSSSSPLWSCCNRIWNQELMTYKGCCNFAWADPRVTVITTLPLFPEIMFGSDGKYEL